MPAAVNTERSGRWLMYCSKAARETVDFVAPVGANFRGFFTHSRELLLGSGPFGLAHFLKVLLRCLCPFAESLACS